LLADTQKYSKVLPLREKFWPHLIKIGSLPKANAAVARRIAPVPTAVARD